ncbi:MAG: YedE-related selenium metabolism membrane protein, partial [Candidatus Dadabacteria bacterium]
GDLEGAGRPRPVPWLVPGGLVAAALVLTALLFRPGVLLESRSGGGALHAPVWASLGAGLAIGVACQRSRFCITGSVRDILLTRSRGPALALGALLLTAGLANGFTGQFRLGYYDPPGAHLEILWNFLGMGLVGLAAVVAGGCPFRQIVRAGEGDLDAAAVVVGMGLGAALVQAWGLGATAAGVPAAGKVAVLLGLAALLGLGASVRSP